MNNSSDFIVGFCGETEESFAKSLDLIREFRFKNSFIFKYSPRPGTKAHELFADDVSEDVKRRRNNEMLDLQNEISEEDNVAFIGEEVEVLVEGPSKSAQRASRAEELFQPHDHDDTSVERPVVHLSVATEPAGTPIMREARPPIAAPRGTVTSINSVPPFK